MSNLSRALRRKQQKTFHLKNLDEAEALSLAYIEEAKIKLTQDVTTFTTHRVIGMQLMVLHKYWGFSTKRLLRYLENLVEFSGDMVTEDIKHDDIHAALIEECGIDFTAAMNEIREKNKMNIKARQAELVDLRTKRLLGGDTIGEI